MRIPILDLKAQHAHLQGDLRAALERVLESGIFCLGPEVQAFESEVGACTAPAAAVGVSNGTDALLVALLALDIGPGDEVIIPPFSFFATASAVVRSGANPVFADIREDTYNLDPDLVEAAITPRTRAIIPVHLYGQCADMEAINALADRHGLRVIEDAAQALGATRNGTAAGSLGDLACFSFYPTKNLGALGEAGLVCARDPRLVERCRVIRNQGMQPQYVHHIVGGNYRMDALQGATLRVKLGQLALWNARRGELAAAYNERLEGVVGTPVVSPGNVHIYHQYTIRTPKRDDLAASLKDQGIASGVYYPIPLHQQPALQAHANGRSFPVSERASAEVLSLPIYPELSDDAVSTVAAAIRAFHGR